MNDETRRLVITSNRLPFVLERRGGAWRSTPGSGGLVTALAPVLRNRGGLWIGWSGIAGDVDLSVPMAYLSKNAGFAMRPVPMSQDELDMYYRGLSNEVLWPLFHDLQSYCNFDPAYWKAYLSINRRFAAAIRESAYPEDFVWIHDYHLLCAASELRMMGVSSRLGFFLHIPFPPPDIFVKLPWRTEVLRALLEYDLIGFQTARDRRNFIQCLRTFFRKTSIEGKGQVVTVSVPGRTVRVGYFPISIDYDEFASGARSPQVGETAWYLHEKIPEGKIVLGVDRLDYTKGIRYRLRAFAHLLEHHPELRGRLTLVQIVVPSRREIPMYRDLKIEIERLVGDINGRYTMSGWVPIHYLHRSLDRRELLAYYRTAEIALITPLKDGMNLVAKEYCASNIEQTGTLILSEFAGAAPQLQKGALLVNPYSIEEVAGALFRAWSMDAGERRERMRRMQHTIQRYDIYWWVDSFLQAAVAETLDAFPVLEEYHSSVNLLSPVEFD